MSINDNPHAAETTPTTQQEHPWRAALRTVVAYLVVVVPVLNIALGIIVDELQTAGLASDHWVFAWLNGAILVFGVIIAIVNRIALIPGINDLLTRIGLGPTPSSTK